MDAKEYDRLASEAIQILVEDNMRLEAEEAKSIHGVILSIDTKRSKVGMLTTKNQRDINTTIINYPLSAVNYLYQNPNLNENQLQAMLLNANEANFVARSAMKICLRQHKSLPPSLLSILASNKSSQEIFEVIANHPNASEETRVLASLRLGALASAL